MKKSLFILMLASFLASCSKDFSTRDNSSESDTAPQQELIVLGKKLENPYSLSNMQKAYDEVHSTKTKSVTTTTLQPTDLYVRFLPKDSAEYRLLEEDKLELFDYPMDYDIEQSGNYYHDPSIPEGQITWQYTTVKPDYKFPEIQYEILEECYIPDDNDETVQTKSVRSDVSQEVEYVALKNANLLDRLPSQNGIQPKGFFSTYAPSGRFTVYDTRFQKLVPVKGVKIRCHLVVKWSTTFTDYDGNYKMGSKYWIGPHYAMIFENSKSFTIWGNWAFLSAATYNMGFRSPKGYSRDIYTNTDAWDWASVNNSAYEYYNMCDQTGIQKPPHDLKIWSFRHASASSASMMRRVWHPIGINSNSTFLTFLANMFLHPLTGVLGSLTKAVHPDITIGSAGYSSDGIHESVFHELSHASHFQQVGMSYWADYIKYIVTYGAYGNGSGYNAGICAVGEMWGHAMGYINKYEKYSGRVPDSYPQSDAIYFFKPSIIWDMYRNNILTKKQIYDCLMKDVKSVEQLKQRMIQLYPSKSRLITNTFSTHGQ